MARAIDEATSTAGAEGRELREEPGRVVAHEHAEADEDAVPAEELYHAVELLDDVDYHEERHDQRQGRGEGEGEAGRDVAVGASHTKIVPQAIRESHTAPPVPTSTGAAQTAMTGGRTPEMASPWPPIHRG